jgi:hypothetical protein
MLAVPFSRLTKAVLIWTPKRLTKRKSMMIKPPIKKYVFFIMDKIEGMVISHILFLIA